MKISLIGMSGSGKSTWSKKLVKLGFLRFCCDDLIAKNLNNELKRSDGTFSELGQWMGFPFEPRYKEREAKYLRFEIEVLLDIMGYFESGEYNDDENIVIDTTGSAIYAGENVLKELRKRTLVVHLGTPKEVQELMLKAYLSNQRPVLWRDLFSKNKTETHEAALARCYPRLLESREREYERIAHITIDYYILNKDGFGVNDFLDIVNTKQSMK